jgi:tetratricopeptide (TPR) repeat protein
VLAKEAETHPASLLVKIWNKIAGLPFIFAALLEQIRELTPQSLKAWEKALAVQPKSIFILNKIAQNLMEQRDPQSAFLVYEEINQLEPLNLSALKNLANLSLQLNQQQKARQYYEKILNVLPHDLEAERGLKNLDALGSLKKEV